MSVLMSIIKIAILAGVGYYMVKILYALITQPNLRFYLSHTLKEIKNMYYRYYV